MIDLTGNGVVCFDEFLAGLAQLEIVLEPADAAAFRSAFACSGDPAVFGSIDIDNDVVADHLPTCVA